MGGYGSGWHGGNGRPAARATVEDALRFTLGGMRPFIAAGERRLAAGGGGVASSGTTTWRRGDEVTSRMGFSVEATEGFAANEEGALAVVLRFGFPAGDAHGAVVQRVRLTRTRVHGGGARWWLRCPECERRCGVIYLAPGAREFACRGCARLTYESCRESRRYDGLFRLLAAQTGTDAATVRRSLRRG